MEYLILGLLIVAIVLLIANLFKKTKTDNSELERGIRDELSRTRSENAAQINALSDKINSSSAATRETLLKQGGENIKAAAELKEDILLSLSRQNEKINSTLTESVTGLRESNEKKLDQMRETVDEKLTSVLTERLDSSFKTVSEQLKEVHESMGEMKKLAADVGDLQRVLTNVKTRGTWAEVQLGNILEQTIPIEYFERNVSTRGTAERVEFAVKIPSRDESGGFVWLPIDSKFPQEDYIRLCDAAEKGNAAAVEEYAKALEKSVKKQAETISKLYVEVPKTTDFAIMFLPTEGLYSEVLRRPGLSEEIERKYRVMICGPTTITAFLSTLQMGFKTIAIDRKASEVRKLLGAVKAQYEKFELLLVKARKKIDEAGATLDDARKRNGIIRKNLKSVEEPDAAEADRLIESGE